MANGGPEDAVFDETIDELRAIGATNCLEQTLRVGKLLLERFFEGDFRRWHDRRRNKDTSLRSLAQRPDCPYRRSKLSSAIGVYEIWSEVPCVRTCGHVQCSHLAAVVGLTRTEQDELLRRAESARWTVRTLRREVAERRRLAGDLRGRNRPEIKPVHVLLRTLVMEAEELALAQDVRLDPAEREEIRECAKKMLRSAEAMHRVLALHKTVAASSRDRAANDVN